VSAGRFREDLYFRIGQPEIRLPPLRERVEEVPWHIQQVLDACSREGGRDLRAGASFVEACALRHWPGNVRELRSEVRRAAATVVAHGEGQLSAGDLSPTAGTPLGGTPLGGTPAPRSTPLDAAAVPEDAVAVALAESGGNVASAARQLGVHRNKVRRWLDRHRVDANLFKSSKGPAGRGSGRGGADDR
jgi:transcriptional regulator with GAF, ATPase, and Fis domain